MKQETITWRELPTDGMPDADITVLLTVRRTDGDAETWPGWWSGEHWMDASTGDQIERNGTSKVVAWAEMPAGEGDDYGATDFGFVFAGISCTDGDKRLLSLVTRALGNDHPAFDDLVALVMAARSKPASPAVAVGDAVSADDVAEAMRKLFVKLPRYSFLLDDKGNVRRVADATGNWVEFQQGHTLFDPSWVEKALSLFGIGGRDGL